MTMPDVNRERLLERFLRYVQVDTTAADSATDYPSSAGQMVLGSLLVNELSALGLADAEQSKFGIVLATLPSNADADVPTVAFNSHLDTSPETTGKDVKPQVIRAYAGGDIQLPGDASKVIRVAECPELANLIGRTLITTDGTTLLGGDDKAGIAIIMEVVEFLCEHPEVPHGPLRVLFTCDEEIGHGVDHVDLKRLDAVVGYTFDGGGAGNVDTETFSADMAVVTIGGANIHPSIAKGRMVNAIRVAGHFIDRLPRNVLAPEVSEGRDGFMHPYTIEGGVGEVTVRVLLRDFNSAALSDQADLLSKAATEVMAEFPGSQIAINIVRQYRNLGDGLKSEPRAVAYAAEAHRRLGREANFAAIRGGTDGSILTEKGLPTPNLSSGQHTPHSPLEWACLDEMVQAVEVGVELLQVWAEGPSS